jgi:hypothetical protein
VIREAVATDNPKDRGTAVDIAIHRQKKSPSFCALPIAGRALLEKTCLIPAHPDFAP